MLEEEVLEKRESALLEKEVRTILYAMTIAELPPVSVFIGLHVLTFTPSYQHQRSHVYLNSINIYAHAYILTNITTITMNCTA